ncbi:MAG: helix-hairpin-helix domain-containing protein [Desulfuromonadaceae bacterium]
MKIVTKITLIAVSLLLSVAPAFAAEVKTDTKPSPAAAMEKAKGTAAAEKAAAKAPLVDINTATDAELKAIPGIGDALAAKIIAGRPYANKAQLKSRKVLPPLVYEQVKDRIIAKQPAKSEKGAAKPVGKK